MEYFKDGREMCIRDSGMTALIAENGPHFVRSVRKHIKRNRQDHPSKGNEAVSYTHLDVYKRQVYAV